jgi:hypothetical protein
MRARFSASVVLLLIVASLVLPLAAVAVEEAPADEPSTTTTFAEGEEPAIVDPALEVEAEEQPWTARFLYPALVATAVLIIAGVMLRYIVRIKGRYRVVE